MKIISVLRDHLAFEVLPRPIPDAIAGRDVCGRAPTGGAQMASLVDQPSGASYAPLSAHRSLQIDPN